MPWPFERDYMQLALLAGTVVGACAPLVGSFLVQRRMSLMGDGIGHAAFAGVAGGVLLGVWPVWSAMAVSVAAALGIERLRRREAASGDLALALFFYSGIAAGVVMMGLSRSLDAGVLSYLFGSILTVSGDDVRVVLVVGAVVATVVAVAGRAMFALVLDEQWAAVAGLPCRVLNDLIAVLAAIVIVAAMRVVGLLLVAALMVLPVASGQLLSRSFRGTVVWSSAIGVLSVVAGLVAARAWGLAPGGSIVLVCALIFALLSLLGRRVHIGRGSHV
ncbi:MAG TPA: metal ABC transporter permease [Actinomycetota bacterium]|nr:metal ABC transporter permease [Actinomycetota bacterium]